MGLRGQISGVEMSQALLHRSRVSAGGLHGSLASSLLVVRGRCVYRCTAVIRRSSIASAMTTATSPATDDHYIVDLEPEYFAFGATYKTSCCSTDSERPHRCCCMLIISTAGYSQIKVPLSLVGSRSRLIHGFLGEPIPQTTSRLVQPF